MPLAKTSTRLEASDLIKEAAKAGFEIKPRLLTDWAAVGLIDRPDARGRGKGKGKSYTWPSEQAGLLVSILRKRQEGAGRQALLNMPCATWLIWGERHVPLRQARRALSTWAGTSLVVGPEKAGRAIKDVLAHLDHPDTTPADQKALRALLERIAFGQPYQAEELVERVRDVMDPNRVGIARGLLPGAALTPEIYARTIEARICGAGHAQRDDLEDAVWLGARERYLAHGPITPFLAELRAPNPLGVLTPQAHEHFNYALNNACQHLIQALGELALEQTHQPATPTTN